MQMANMVLKDHAAADHTFVPRDLTGGVATFVNSTGVPIGDNTVSYAVSRTQTGKRKVTLKVVLPIVQDVVVNGISKPTVVRTSYADVVFSFDPTSNTTERSDALAYLVSLLGNTQAVAGIDNLESPF